MEGINKQLEIIEKMEDIQKQIESLRKKSLSQLKFNDEDFENA